MRVVALPKVITVSGQKIRLTWQTLDSLDGWFAEVSPVRVRNWEKDPTINMNTIERELGEYGDFTRYVPLGVRKDGYLCLYIRA